MKMLRKTVISIIGSQMDLGAFLKGVDMGPLAIRHAGLIHKIEEAGLKVEDCGDIIHIPAENEGNSKKRYEKEINESNERLYNVVLECINKNNFPIVIGGDHSVSIGSVSAILEKYIDVGIIWVDAHADFNDETITPSGNIHGMSLSAVCGCGPESLVPFCNRRADPHNAVIIGARSIDLLEKEKLKEKGIIVFSINDVHSEGINRIIHKAIEIAGTGTRGIHLSFDMDALDPTQAPGVGTPVYNGLTQRESFIICEELFKSGLLLCADVVETNPLLDNRNMTGILASELILSCLGGTVYR